MKKAKIRYGLAGMLLGAGTMIMGCESPQSNYDGNGQQRRGYDSGEAGLDALQLLFGLGSVNKNSTPDQMNAAGIGYDMMRENRRNEAVRESGTTVNVYNERGNSIANFKNVDIKHNVKGPDGSNGMEIHSAFRVCNKLLNT